MTKELKTIYLECLHTQIKEWSEKVKDLRNEIDVEFDTGCTWSQTQLRQALHQLTALENAAAELATA